MGNIIKSALLIIILGFLAYGNSLDGKFIRDDFILISDNTYIRSPLAALSHFTPKAAIGDRQKWSSYRPFQMLTYALDYSIWGLNVKGYHLTNTLFHILVALAIYWFINILFDDKILSLFTGILFVVNPLHTEAVSYISGRADSLCTLFMLLALIFYIKGIYVPMVLSYVLALLSRENALILPVLSLLYHYTFKEKLKTKSFFSVLGITLVYILLRATLLRGLMSDVVCSSTVFERLPGLFVAIANYARLLIVPLNLHTAYGLKLFNFTNPKAILGIFILASLLVYVLKKRETNKLVFFSVCWFFITLLPQSNLYPLNAFMAEHWLYLPSIGFFLVVSKGLSSLYRTKEFRNVALIIIAFLTAFYAYLTIRQNDYWKEPLHFYQRTLKYVPDDYGEWINLGLTYVGIGKEKEALNAFNKALELNPNYADAHYNLGKFQYNKGEKTKAITSFKRAIEQNSKHTEAYHNLGNAYNDVGKKSEAIASYRKAIETNPYHGDSYYALGNIYFEIGAKEKAVASYKKAIEINPLDAEVHYNLAVVYFYDGHYELAARHADRARALGFKISPKFLKLLEPYR